jgi:hypothetical protein
MATWNYEKYQAWIQRNYPRDDTVHILLLDNNQLTSIPPEIGQLQNLTQLSLNYNQLTSIPPEIGQLQNLRELSLYSNRLTSIPPEIGQLQNLRDLVLGINQLTSIPPEIGQLQNLTQLSLDNNQLTSIPPEIGQLQNLAQLWLDHNQLTSIPSEIGNLQNLTQLWLYGNSLTSIPPEIGQLHHLTHLSLGGNPIDHIPLNVQRLLRRQRVVARGVYADAQSVHNSSIQQSLRESILRLLKTKVSEKDVIPHILTDPTLTPFTKESLIEYSKDESVHTSLNVSFADILALVWNRIMTSPHSEEIKAVLNTEMRDAECKCFTGRISRLVNCLNGFDPFVVVQISDNEQIGTVISLIKTQLEEKNDYTVERHKEETSKRLLELGVEEGEIEVWLSYIEE